MSAYVPAVFRRRWRLNGVLTTESLLHVGTGDTVTRPKIRAEKDGKSEPVAINAVARDVHRNPVMPASALRGVLRSRLYPSPSSWRPVEAEEKKLKRSGKTDAEKQSAVDELWRQWVKTLTPEEADAVRLFGMPNAQQAGWLVVQDARQPEEATPPEGADALPFWDPAQRTAVVASAAIDRRRRAVAPGKLFHTEVVPPGAVFHVELMIDHADDATVALLIRALESGLAVGADTANGWGRVSFALHEVKVIEPPSLRDWVQAGDPAAPLPWAERTALFANRPKLSSRATSPISFELTLEFSGLFLTKDPDRSLKANDATPQVTHSLRTPEGHAVLTARGARGVVRSQAERILRTLGLPAGDPTAKLPTQADWDGEAGVLSFTPEDLAARVFGAPGWRSPVEFSNFTGTGTELTHEMVALDRFTGAVAGSRKFTMRAFWKPVLKGTVTFHPSLWERAGCAGWAEGLLALVLRDLREGDLRFGLGAAKGYGRCTSDIDPLALLPNASAALRALLEMSPFAAPPPLPPPPPPPPPVAPSLPAPAPAAAPRYHIT